MPSVGPCSPCSPSRMRPSMTTVRTGARRRRGRADDGRDLAMLPGAASPWRVTDPRRRVPRARQTAPRRNGAACYSAVPELVRLDEVRPAVYRVAWWLSSAASGRLRRRD